MLKLGETDFSKEHVGQANSVGPIAHFGETEIITTGNREFARPSR